MSTMTSLLSLLLLLLIVARESVSQLNSTQRQLLLDLHNQARSEVSPTAANMEEMVSACPAGPRVASHASYDTTVYKCMHDRDNAEYRGVQSVYAI